MWAAKTPNGPSMKLHVQNVHTMDELKMTGNCLKGSRGIVSFDRAFDESEWGRLVKEVFTHVSTVRIVAALLYAGCGIQRQLKLAVQIFGVPPSARRAKPFIDHILTFSMLDGKIWFRNFQVSRASLTVRARLDSSRD
jgi:ribosome biogenesis protein BRX1